MEDYYRSFLEIDKKRNKLKEREHILHKSVSEQLIELSQKASQSQSSLSSGVYCFHYEDNDMIYIGSAKGGLSKRKNSHLNDLYNKEHTNWQFQLLYTKFGTSKLSFYVIEYCPKESCLERESYYINLLEPEINIAGKPHQFDNTYEEKRAKVVKAQQGWEQTKDGFEWLWKRVKHFRTFESHIKMTHDDMRNRWESLGKNMSDALKVKEILRVYKAYLPENLWKEDDLIRYIKKPYKSKRTKASTSTIIDVTKSQPKEYCYEETVKAKEGPIIKAHAVETPKKQQDIESIVNNIGCILLVCVVLAILFLLLIVS